MKELEETKTVFVCHFDILGMKSVLQRSNDDAWLNICALADAQDSSELPITEESRKSLNERFFSDTIIISTHDDSVASLHTILARSFELFRFAFRRSIPLRGGVAHGKWIERQDNGRELFTGDALLRANELGESQQMIGVCICDVIRNRSLDNPFSFSSGSPVIKDYSIPLKNGVRVNRATLNWPALCEREIKMIGNLEPDSIAQHFYAFGKPDNLPASVRIKHENTIQFIKHQG